MTDDMNKNVDDREPVEVSCDEAGKAPSENDAIGRPSERPEPPARWSGVRQGEQPQGGYYQEPADLQPANPMANGEAYAAIGKTRFKIRGDEIAEFQNARRYITASQIIAVISLFLGGVLVSGIALICAFVAKSKLDKLAVGHSSEPEVQKALARSGYVVIGVAALALILNAVAMVYLQPLVMQSLQSGNLGALAGAPDVIGTGAGSSTWG